MLASRAVPLLATGASSVGPQTAVTIPPGTAPGSYYILAVADADNTVAESNENNKRGGQAAHDYSLIGNASPARGFRRGAS